MKKKNKKLNTFFDNNLTIIIANKKIKIGGWVVRGCGKVLPRCAHDLLNTPVVIFQFIIFFFAIIFYFLIYFNFACCARST